MNQQFNLDTSHFTLTCDGLERISRLSRTQLPFEEKIDIARSFIAIERSLLDIPGGKRRLLFDMRDGTRLLRPALEAEFHQPFAALVRGFERVAVLHQSAVGKLQIQRFARESELSLQVFINANLAEAFLKSSDEA